MITKGKTNKLLSEIDRLTIPIPDLFKDVDDRVTVAYVQCVMCDTLVYVPAMAYSCNCGSPECQSKGTIDPLIHPTLCHECAEDALEPNGHCVVCDTWRSDQSPCNVPTIDDVIYPGNVCSSCIDDAIQRLEPEYKYHYNKRKPVLYVTLYSSGI